MLCNQLVELVHLQVPLELLLLEHKIVLLDFVQNFLCFLFPFLIYLLKIINFFNLMQFLSFVLLNLFLEDLEVNATLSNLLIMVAIILPVLDVKVLNFLDKVGAFDLIISNSFLVCSQFLLVTI